MCLIAKPGTRKIADDDILVYKIVEVPKNHGNCWVGPYSGIPTMFPFDEELTESAPDEQFMLKPIDHGRGECDVVVKSGFFHSFRSMSSAISALHQLLTYDPWKEYKLCRAVIPKGSVYYTPISGSEIASSKIIVKNP